MRCDVDPCDVSPIDLPVFAEFTGLKWYQCENWDFGASHGVTPFAGVWVEIVHGPAETMVRHLSHPSRVCGLKYMPLGEITGMGTSHPSRVCGLK